MLTLTSPSHGVVALLALTLVPIPVALNHNYAFHHNTVIEFLPIVTARAIWVHTWKSCLDVTTRQRFT